MGLNLSYRDVHRSQILSSVGTFGIKVSVSLGPELFDRELTDNEGSAVYRAVELVSEAFLRTQMALCPKAQEGRAADRVSMLAMFPTVFHVEEIPNGYCSRSCCSMIPWFRVLTPIGYIRIGWRKRVINIDWTDTYVKEHGDALFPRAGFTVSSRGEIQRYSHAWGYLAAKDQLNVILASEPS